MKPMEIKIKKKQFFLILISFLFFAEKARAQWNVDSLSVFGLPDAPISIIIGNLLMWLIMIVGVVAMIAFVIAGIMYLTAAGDDNQISRAKKAMTYSIIGIIVGLSGFVILQAVFYMLTGSALF
jgi:hypothetical protein